MAILEYANRFMERGHTVSITTYPDTQWTGDNPFPWFDFKGTIHYKKMRNASHPDTSCVSADALRLLGQRDFKALADAVLGNFGMEGLREAIMQSCDDIPERLPFEFLISELLTGMHTISEIPDCDINIATLWTTAFFVYLSRRGKPVYFMQHYEEILYPLQPAFMMHRLGARLSYALPMYKVANSSWLQNQIKIRFGQDIPFSNNALVQSDFSPRSKKSEHDAIIRVFTYSRPEDWKGFGDAAAAMSMAFLRYGSRLEWHVFGYRHTNLHEQNIYAPYRFHPKLSFAELAGLYATCDIVLCPSWYESFPLPPLEAMASGTAVITTRSGTEDYAFHEKNALVVGSRNIGAMYESICRLVEDEQLRHDLASAGLQTAQTFTWDNAAKERERILLSIHQGDPGYDVLKSVKLGLADSADIEFESAPQDIADRPSGMFWFNGHLYLLQGGMKRHIINRTVIPRLLQRNIGYVEIGELDIIRTPAGPPINTAHDLPDTL